MARVAPFVIFLLLTSAQGQFGPASAYWFYFAKTLAGLWLILEMRPLVAEMRWAFSWAAVLVGVGIFAAWVGLDSTPDAIFPTSSGVPTKVVRPVVSEATAPGLLSYPARKTCLD